MSKTQQRVAVVLNRMLSQVLTNGDDAEMYSSLLDEMLDNLAGEDAFGTEGQSDPRGDGRNGSWNMSRIESVD